jgi:hypothetical protein
MPLASRRLGLVGVADVVEFHRTAGGEDTPFRSNTSAASRRRIAPTRRSFARRACASRR